MTRGGWGRTIGVCLLGSAVLFAAGVEARNPHRPHTPRVPRAPRTPPPSTPTGDDADVPANQFFSTEQTVALPGRGLAVSWDPDGTAIALGGHFYERSSGLRYDTRVYDAATGAFRKSFACHHYWVVATAWTRNPFLGDIVASGGGDHAVRFWDANGAGSRRCSPGQFLAADGARQLLPNVNGWTMAIAFSPDGRYVAGASRDRVVRIWQVAPGPHQWQVVVAWMDRQAGNILSVVWAPDGHALFTGDRQGRVARWDVDPDHDRWDGATVAAFAAVGWEQQLQWFGDNPDVGVQIPTWVDGDHGDVWNVRVAPDGSAVAASGADGTVSSLDAVTGAVRWRHVARAGVSYQGLDWSPDGTLIAAGASDGTILLFDAASGQVRDRLVGHADDVAAVAWSPDGQRLASTAGGPRLSLALAHVVGGPDTSARIWRRR